MYSRLIKDDLAKLGFIGRYDPRHIEAYMTLEHGTLDAMSKSQFTKEVAAAIACIDEGPIEDSEDLAASFGL